MHSQWDSSVTIGAPILLVIFVVCVLAITLAFLIPKDREDQLFFASWPALGLLVAVGFAAFMYWPYQAQYLKYVPKAGVVTETNSRLISDGDKAMSQRIVVSYADGQQYGCDDTRCASLRTGDHVTLLCEKEYQFVGTEGWSCLWGKRFTP
jgi:hypothetical protein